MQQLQTLVCRQNILLYERLPVGATKKEIVSFNKKNVSVGISPKGYGRTFFARRDFEPGEEVTAGFGKVIDHQTPHISVQIGIKKHYLPSKWTGAYWDHSCNPNTYIKTRSDGFPSLIALKKIKKGEEITYAYWMTEFKWSKNADENHTVCKCGERTCKGKILSFSQLPKEEQERLKEKGTCSKYLLEL